MRKRSVVTFGVLALITSSGCAEAGPATDDFVQIDTLANGAVRVTNLGEGLWSAGAGTPWSLVEELRIGSLDGEHDAFARIEAVETLADGRIYVLDRGPVEVRVFDDTGAHLQTFAREGDGPGELRFPASLNEGPDGNLWIADLRANRFTVFSPEGELVTTHRYTADEIIGRGDFAGGGRFHDLSFRRLLVLSEELEPEATIPMPPFEREYFRPPPPSSTSGALRMTALRPVPFTAQQAYALHPDGSLWVGLTDAYSVVRLDASGDTVTVIERTGIEPHPVGAAERSEAEESLVRLIQQGWDVDLSRIPDTKPIYSRLVFADDGHLWVELETEAGVTGQQWDVFDPDGSYLGTVETEIEFERLAIREDVIVGVVRDELDVQYVVRARIVR